MESNYSFVYVLILGLYPFALTVYRPNESTSVSIPLRFPVEYYLLRGPGSVVGIATGY